MTGYGAPGRNDPIVQRARYEGDSRTNASATCAVYRIVNGARDTVAKFDREQDALACLHQLQDEQSTVIEAHQAAESCRAVRELDLLPEKFRQQAEALIAEQRIAIETLHEAQQAEVARVKAIRPISTERYEVVQF